MMRTLQELKIKMVALYGEYSMYIRPTIKFVLALLVFSNINGMLGYADMFNNIFVVLILSLICALLPTNGIIVLAGIMIVVHTFALGVEVGAITLALVLLMYLLCFRVVPNDAVGVLLTPMGSALGIPCMVPMSFGLLREPASAVSVALGTFTYYYLRVIQQVMEPIKAAEEQDILANIQVLLDHLLNHKEMFIFMIANVAVVLLISLMRKLNTNYGWYIAIVGGVALYMLIVMLTSLLWEVEINLGLIIVGTLGAYLISMIIGFFFVQVDYKRTETLRYEDEEYIYYVKAVPKDKIYIRKTQDWNQEVEDYSSVDFETKLEESLNKLK